MELLDDVQEATQRLVRAVDAMTDEQFAEPSLLPGWRRAHLIAHLALNAEAFADVFHALTVDGQRPMYRSDEARDADIDELAVVPPAELRHRLLGATTDFAEAARRMPARAWDAEVERTPGGRTFPVRAVLALREREVEIHHADLDVGYDRSAWPADFTLRLLERMAGVPHTTTFMLTATDLGRSWQCGPDGSGPTVSGTAADLGWWLTGRRVDTLTCDGGLPEVDSL